MTTVQLIRLSDPTRQAELVSFLEQAGCPAAIGDGTILVSIPAGPEALAELEFAVRAWALACEGVEVSVAPVLHY